MEKIKPEDFKKQIGYIIKELEDKLTIKSEEYWRESNPFHNFEKGGRLKNKNPMEVLQGFMLKHEVSVDDLVNDFVNGKRLPPFSVIEEKITDILIYYSILLVMFNFYGKYEYYPSAED